MSEDARARVANAHGYGTAGENIRPIFLVASETEPMEITKRYYYLTQKRFRPGPGNGCWDLNITTCMRKASLRRFGEKQSEGKVQRMH